ncbi:response regulator [Desulfocapsa sp. AH-315-G09]|nr:response regulator [Desulfocapsa sp.]MBN4065120.1 response regulator [Desulfocapsa sp. AH-315-G09]
MNNLTILVVDDDPVIRKLLEQRLIREHYDVLLAEDGQKGNDLLSTNHIDVVLTDLMMPGDIGGIEVLEFAKELERNIDVILITAHSSIDTAVEAMKKGASDYLEKPINFTELFLRLEKISTMRGLLRSAQDLRQAMDVTESTAAKTIQNLEVTAATLQDQLDSIETILTSDTMIAEEKVSDSLNVILNWK